MPRPLRPFILFCAMVAGLALRVTFPDCFCGAHTGDWYAWLLIGIPLCFYIGAGIKGLSPDELLPFRSVGELLPILFLMLLPILFHWQSNNPAWPDAQPYDPIAFVAAAVVVVILFRRTMFDKRCGFKDVIPGTDHEIARDHSLTTDRSEA